VDLDITQILAFGKEYRWWAIVAVAALGAIVPNDKMYPSGYGFGSKYKGLPYANVLAFVFKSIAQLTGGISSWFGGAANGVLGKPLLGVEMTKSRKVEE